MKKITDTDILFKAQDLSYYNKCYHCFRKFVEKHKQKVYNILKDNKLTPEQKAQAINDLIIQIEIKDYIKKQKERGEI